MKKCEDVFKISKDFLEKYNLKKDYDSVIGMNKDNSINRFMKKDSIKHFPAIGEASLSGVIVNCNLETGLADSIESYIFGGLLKNT